MQRLPHAINWRKIPRLRIRIGLKLVGAKTAATGLVRDITENGLQVFSSKTFPAGTALQVALHLPGSAPTHRFDAEVRWSKVDKQGHHILGCRFVHGGDSRERLKDFLTKFMTAVRLSAPARRRK